MGTESVTINDGGLSETIVLSQEWTEFVAFSSTIAIEFTNDDGFDREIDFESNFETNIIAQQQWSNWDCDSDNENLRCQIVRNGRFAWDATYLITFGEEITDYGFVRGGLCGENWTDMMRGAIELSRNSEEPAKDPMECAKLTAENSECGSYFVQRNDYTTVGACLNKEFTPIAAFETIGRYIRLEIPTEAFTNYSLLLRVFQPPTRHLSQRL
eukprot:UN04681